MKTPNSIIHGSLILLLAAGWTGCASAPKDKEAKAAPSRNKQFPTADAVLRHEDVKEKPPTVFAKPIEDVRPAALRALNFVGCNIHQQEDFYLAGKRPQKMGFFVGSGGETVEVFLYPAATNVTHVWVDTDLSFVGMAGQQGWNKQVLEELTRLVNQAKP